MLQRLRALLSRHRHAHFAVADQLLVSGVNFLTGIVLARLLGPAAFGVFVLLQAVMLYVNAFQVSLIFSPMLSNAPQMEEAQRAAYLRGVLALQLALSLLLALVVWGLGTAGGRLFPVAALEPSVVLALAAAILAFQLQDWLRRYYFLRQKAGAAFANDIISYGGQLVLLVWFALTDDLALADVMWIMAGTSAAAFVLGYLISRAPVRPAFHDARAVLREGWRAGRDYFVAWQMQWAGTQGVLLVGAGLLGTQAAGGVRAAQNIIGPINILFQAMENVVPVVAAKRYKEGGLPALSHYLWRNTAWGSALLLPVMAGLAFAAEPLTRLVYGAPYVAYASLVIWQAAAMFLQFYLRQLTFFLRTVQATGVIIQVGATIAITSVLVALCTIGPWQEVGVMLALLAGGIAGLLRAGWAARRIARELSADSRAAARATRRVAIADMGGRR